MYEERKKERKRYYNNITLTNLKNRRFWKTVKPFLSDQGSYIWKINLVNTDDVISGGSTLAETFSKFYGSAVQNLGICEEINTRTDFESSDPVGITLLKYKYHPSVLKIKKFVGENISEFHFSETTIDNIENEI